MSFQGSSLSSRLPAPSALLHLSASQVSLPWSPTTPGPDRPSLVTVQQQKFHMSSSVERYLVALHQIPLSHPSDYNMSYWRFSVLSRHTERLLFPMTSMITSWWLLCGYSMYNVFGNILLDASLENYCWCMLTFMNVNGKIHYRQTA